MRFAQITSLLFGFWVLLTGSLAALDLAIGAVVSLAVGYWAVKWAWADTEPPVLSVRQAARFLLYIPYLVKEIIIASLYVAAKVLDPRLPIAPTVITHRVSLARPVSRVALANSITLTPGTLTVDLDGTTLLVHCLDEEFAEGIESGALEQRIASVFEGV